MRRSDRRWPVVMGLGATQIINWGSTFYLLAVLAQPIAKDTSWPLPWIAAGLSVGLLSAALVSLKLGSAMRKYGGRNVLAAGSIAMAVGMAVMAWAPSLELYLVAWVLLGFGMAAGLYDAAFAALGSIYGRGARSLVASLTLIAGFSSTITWPMSAVILHYTGWRSVCLAYVALHVLVALPLHLLMLPKHTSPQAPDTGGEAGTSPLLALSERPSFLMMASALTTISTIAAVLSVHVIAMMTGNGLALDTAVGLAALIGPSQVLARFIEVAAGHRYHPLWTLLAAATLILLGLAILLLAPPLVWLALVIYGAGAGIGSIARGTVPLSIFGAARYPSIMGRLAFVGLLAQAAAPPIAAVILIANPDLLAILLVALAALAVAFVVCLLNFKRDRDQLVPS
ncbi:MAG: MFS transporter [Mesorhizobium sp.]|nr:MAG: MFS transporter [Mesorhizobium sp.]TJU96068.1 MAG: MFS transporter [Mesorhizobium sp.]TJV16340.1 MAG: MFS transporter [Mesorhizobium sp.]